MQEFPAVEIVVSSAWRTELGIDRLRSLFSDAIGARVIDITPDRSVTAGGVEPNRREREIEDWLRENGREYEPWIAVDDSDWLFSAGCTRLILVDGDTGFSEHATALLRRRLRASAG